jgi:polyphosphate kinase
MRPDVKTQPTEDAATPAPPDSSQRTAPVVGEHAPAIEPIRATTPSDPSPMPEPDADGRHDLGNPEYYLNRELTWLNFNFRVLAEAEDQRVPLLERAKFIAIVSSNIDEFFSTAALPKNS